MMKGNYLLITPFFPDANSFVGSYVYDQVKAIQEEGTYQPIVVRLRSLYEPKMDDYEFEGISCLVFRFIDLPSFSFPGLFHGLNAWRFKRFLKRKGVDVSTIQATHTHVTYPAAYIGDSLQQVYNIPNMVQHHGLDVMQLDLGKYLGGWLKKMQHRILKLRGANILNRAALNIGVSQAVLNQFEQQGVTLQSKKTVLYNGVDRQKFYPIDTPANDRFTIGCIANFWELKDQITLIKAVEQLLKSGEKAIEVQFIGTGPTLEYCQKYIAKNKLEAYFTFLQPIPHNELNAFYNAIDLFVLPSYYEALGCVYLEAYAAGTPFIAVFEQGVEELVPEHLKEHYLIQKGKASDLAQQIVNIQKQKAPPLVLDKNIDIGILVREFLKQVKVL